VHVGLKLVLRLDNDKTNTWKVSSSEKQMESESFPSELQGRTKRTSSQKKGMDDSYVYYTPGKGSKRKREDNDSEEDDDEEDDDDDDDENDEEDMDTRDNSTTTPIKLKFKIPKNVLDDEPLTPEYDGMRDEDDEDDDEEDEEEEELKEINRKEDQTRKHREEKDRLEEEKRGKEEEGRGEEEEGG
jgi:hypothetical protein